MDALSSAIIPSNSADAVALYAYMANNFSLALAVIVALVATVLVFSASRRMRGGLFGSVLGYMSAGMLCVVIGFVLTVVHVPQGSFGIEFPLKDIAFMIGYILMLLGARKFSVLVTPPKKQ